MSDAKVKVLTHSGRFHADEVFACATIALARCDGRSDRPLDSVEFRRSRNAADYDWADVIVDVGGRYSTAGPDKWWFDHHQVEGAGRRVDGVPYASAGLVWSYFSWAAIDEVVRGTGDTTNDAGPFARERWIEARVDRDLIAYIDAADNGYDLAKSWRDDTAVRPCTVSHLVGGMNPAWDATSSAASDKNFYEAVDWAVAVLRTSIRSADAAYRAREVVRSAYEDGGKGFADVLVLPVGCPWVETLLTEIKDGDILYVVYPEPDTGWMVQAVPKAPGSIENRKSLPASWAGLRNGLLAAASGVPDAVFCHRNRFICGAKSKEGALALAVKALAEPTGG